MNKALFAAIVCLLLARYAGAQPVGPIPTPGKIQQYPQAGAAAAGGNVTVVQSTFQVKASTYVNLLFPAATTSGNMMVCGVSLFNDPTPGINTPTSNSGTFVFISSQQTTGDVRGGISFYYAKNITGNAATRVNVNNAGTGGGDATAMGCIEVSGANTVTPLDGTGAIATGTSNHLITSSMTPTNNNELLVGVGTHAGATLTFSKENTNWTLVVSSGDGANYQPLAFGHRGSGGGLVSGAPGYPAGFGVSASVNWACLGALFTP